MGIKRIKILFALFAAALVAAPPLCGQAAGTQAADSLAARRAELSARQESLHERLAKVRRLFNTDETNREAYSAEIVRLEGELFALRDTLGAVSEQLAGLGSLNPAGQTGGSAGAADARRAYFVSTEYVRNSLSAADYAMLTQAQEQEREAAAYLNTIKYNYAQLAGLDTLYAKAIKGPRADSLYAMISRFAGENEALADSLSAVWPQAFENKTYLYNVILDRNNRRAAMDEMERGMREMLAEAEEIEGAYMYDAVALYPLQKELILNYEIRIAENAGLVHAADSLRAAARNLDAGSYFMPVIDTGERLFIDYSDYVVTGRPVYDGSNPIPKTLIYPKGTVYRVFVGAFSGAQPVSLFRNVSPLSYEIKKDRMYHYYIGGYRSYGEAADAAARLKRHGFKNPRVAVWVDGRYDADPVAPLKPAAGKNFRVEIRNTGSGLSGDVTELIRRQAPGKEVSRIPDPGGEGYIFVIGVFGNHAAAEKLQGAIAAAAPELQLSVGTI